MAGYAEGAIATASAAGAAIMAAFAAAGADKADPNASVQVLY